jgi:hypothetical protein
MGQLCAGYDQDEVRRRLLFADHEGEMRVVGLYSR